MKELVQQGPADVIIGKNGLSEGVLGEIDRRLKEKSIVKVKALKSAIKVTGLDRRELARRVAERLGARLLDVRGRTFVLYRPEPRRERPEANVRNKIRSSRERGAVGRRTVWSQR
ncbi:YhbY family RNA-binding protein [Pyrodictium occultum]|uniref:YhbY family RNA-binding protein n=1 Tax=Pyrodictium occultum TaxID=2309 RepID=UPI003083FBE7